MRPLIFTLAVILLTSPAAAGEDENAERVEIQNQAATLFERMDWVVLNDLAAKYRDGTEKTSSGMWKLMPFYFGLGLSPLNQDRTPQIASRNITLAEQWVLKAPSPAAYIALAEFHRSYAWLIRGTGYADSVTPEQWDGFYSESRIAHDVLAQHKDKAGMDPEYYAVMVAIARDEHWSPIDDLALFKEATQNYKYYPNIYEQMLVTAQPQWGGSYDIIKEVTDFAERNTKDKLGEEMYARLFWHLQETCHSCEQQTGGFYLLDWNRVKSGFQQIVTRYPTQWNLNYFAYFSCGQHDKDTRGLMAGINAPVLRAWEGDTQLYDRCKSRGTVIE